MAMRIQCTQCESSLNVSEDLKGKTIRCPKCKELTRVPGGQARQTAMPSAKPGSPPQRKSTLRDDDDDAPRSTKPSEKTMLMRSHAESEGIVDRKKAPPVAVPRKPKKTAAARDYDDDDDRPVRRSSRRDDDDDDDDAPVRGRKGKKSAKSGISPMIWVGAGVGGLTLIGGIVLMAVLLMRPSVVEERVAVHQPVIVNEMPKPADAVKKPEPVVLPNKGDAPVKNDPEPKKVPETKDPEPKQPVVQSDPGFKGDGSQATPIPSGPTPSDIEPATTKKVKKATVYLKVKSNDRESWEGSGFFGVERGIVFTNAHVVGMLGLTAKAPKEIEVVVNSGQKGDEFKLIGTVLGVDRDNDLAVVRVTGDLDKCPQPLPVELSETSLTELQKVYIFGFPHGASLGKEITASTSSVSSFRRDVDGSLFQIQVNGGMHPGNSGGPVVDSRGVVVGVSVAGIRGTTLNFAVPSEKIQGMLHGRVQETNLGVAYKDNQAVKLPLKVSCLDPLNRIKDVKVDIWSGPAGPARAMSLKAPAALPGDSPKQSVALTYHAGLCTHDLVIPTLTLPEGHVYWIQPTLVTHAGLQQWGSSTTISPADITPLNRVPANLTFSTVTSERNLDLSGKFEEQFSLGKQKIIVSDDLNFKVLEEVTKDTNGTALRVAMGPGDFTSTTNSKTKPRQEEAQTMVKRKIFTYATDATGKLERFGFPQFRPGTVVRPINPKGKYVPPPPHYSPEKERMYDEAEDMATMFNLTYQLSSLALPNRQVQPLEVWDAKITILVGSGRSKKTPYDLIMKYTYEGNRTINGKTEAVITITGEVENRKASKYEESSSRPKMRVIGQGNFDVTAGFFSKLKVAIRADGEGGSFVLEVNLKRTAGNGYKIGPLPPPGSSGNLAQELQGTWELVSGQWDGKDDNAKIGKSLTITGDDYVYVHDQGTITEKGKFTVNTTKTPKEMVMQFSGNTRSAIYEVQGDKLTMCVAIGGPLPKTFEAKGNVLMVWKRTSTPVKTDANPNPNPVTQPDAPPKVAGKTTVDLIALIDTTKDVIHGNKWTVANKVLQCGDSGLRPRVQIPYQPPEEYDFTVTFSQPKLRNGVSLIMPNPKGGKSFHWNVGTNRGEATLSSSPPTRQQSPALAVVANKAYTATVQVRKTGVSCLLDGKVVMELKTDFSNLTSDRWHEIRDKSFVGVACDDPTVFHYVQIVEITGKGKNAR